MNKIAAALALLQDDELREKLAAGPGVLGGFANVLKAGDKAGQAASQFLHSKGQDTLGTIARFVPHATVAYAGKKAYDSKPAQGLRNKYRAYKIRKAMRQVQRGY